MKNSFTKALIGTVAAGTVLLSLSAASWSMGHGGGMSFDPARMVAHMTDRLDLSEEQESEVTALLSATSEQSASDRQRLGELREGLRAQRDNFDAGTSQKMADEIGEITARMVFQATSTHAQIYQLLSEEQRVQMDEMMAKREERRGKWRKDGKNGQRSTR